MEEWGNNRILGWHLLLSSIPQPLQPIYPHYAHEVLINSNIIDLFLIHK